MIRIPTCKASLLAPFVGALESRSLHTERYLELCMVPRELVADERARIALDQARRFVDLVEEREGIRDLGVLMGAEFSLADLGPLGDALRNAVTLHDAIDTLANLLPTLAEGNHVNLRIEDETAWLEVHAPDLDLSCGAPAHFTNLCLLEVVRMVGGPDWVPSAVEFQTEHTTAMDNTEVFGDAEKRFLTYGTAIAFPATWLSDPLRNHGRNGAAPEARAIHAPLSTSIEAIVTARLPYGVPKIEEMAEIARVSRPTLFRALREEGVTYRQLVNRAKFERGRQLLADDRLSIKEIAAELGYSSPNNFSIAFKRLANSTPSQFRARLNR